MRGRGRAERQEVGRREADGVRDVLAHGGCKRLSDIVSDRSVRAYVETASAGRTYLKDYTSEGMG